MQIRTSAGTSINSKKLPRIYSKLGAQMRNREFIDYGCGRYTDHLEKYATEQNAVAFFYDPYNRTERENAETMAAWTTRKIGFAICSNVLNVIDSDEAVTECIGRAVVLGNGTAFFTVYEGDKSGTGKETMGGESWQRNMKLKDYERFVPDGMKASFKNGMMIVRRV